MRDRLSTKILSNGATRYGVYDETGNLLRYEYIKLEDEPTVEGDLFSKANMLPDSIPALLGLKMANPQVKDALNVLANVGNLHVWDRVLTTIDASYVERRVNISDANIFSSDYQSSRYYARFNVSDSINITSSGDISLVSPTQVEIYFQNGALYNFDSLKGKYISYVSTASNSSSSFPGTENIGYVSSDAEVSITYSNYYQAKITSGAYKVYSVFVPAGTSTDYLTSTDRDAYPDNVTDAQDAYYTLGDVVSGTIVPVTTSQVQFKYSTTVTVYDNGDLNVDGYVVNLQNYNTEGTSTIKGKYIVPVTTGASISGVWFIPSDATFSLISEDGNPTKQYLYCDKMQPVIGHAAIPASTIITYLGQLGNRARIEVGSYVGTGTYGSSNPNTLTFGFEPKIVFVVGRVYLNLSNMATDFAVFNMTELRDEYLNAGYFEYSPESSTSSSIDKYAKKNGNTLSWYSSRSKTYQMNGIWDGADSRYTYIAIG